VEAFLFRMLLKNVFLVSDMVDVAAHETCWGCPLYYHALKSVEMKIKLLIDALNQTQDSSGRFVARATPRFVISWDKVN
jgi:hypothetical protein